MRSATAGLREPDLRRLCKLSEWRLDVGHSNYNSAVSRRGHHSQHDRFANDDPLLAIFSSLQPGLSERDEHWRAALDPRDTRHR